MAKKVSSKKTGDDRSSSRGGRGSNDRDDKRREINDSDSMKVGSEEGFNRDPLPDDMYLNGIIRRIEVKENVTNSFNAEPFDKFSIAIELPDFPDEEGDQEFRMCFASAKKSMHPKSNFFKYVKGILDYTPQDGQDFNPAWLIGCPCRVLLKTWDNDDGTVGQCVDNFKPYEGDLSKGMKDVSEVIAMMEGGSSRGSSSKGSKKTSSKKTSSKKTSSKKEVAVITEDYVEQVTDFVKELGTAITDVCAELGLTKKAVKEALGEGVDGNRAVLCSLYLYSQVEKRKFSEDQFEKLEDDLTKIAEAHDLDVNKCTSWTGAGCRMCAESGAIEWPPNITGVKQMVGRYAEGGEEVEEAEDTRPEVGTTGMGVYPDDGEKYGC